MANPGVEQLIKSNQAARGQGYTVGQYIPLDQIRIDGGTQARAGLDEATVAEYAESWLTLSSRQNGFLDMPLIVVYHDGKDYWLADGFHRVEAYKRFVDGPSASASARAIRAEVRMGTKRDAVLYACGANATHGLRRTQADKRRAILTLLEDPEWRQWSDSEIARRCNVTHPTVAAVRKERYPENLQDSRIVQRGGATYQQKPPAPKLPSAAQYKAAQERALRLNLDLRMHDSGAFSFTQIGTGKPSGGAVDWAALCDLLDRKELAQKPNIPEVAPPASSPGVASGSAFIDRTSHGTPPDLFTANLSLILEPNGWIILLRGPGTTLTPNHYRTAEAAISFARENLMPPEKGSEAARIMNTPWPVPAPDPASGDVQAIKAEIRAKAGALGMGLLWEDDGALLYWPNEDIDQLMPLSYEEALNFLASQPTREETPREVTSTPRRLTPGAHAQAMTLLSNIRTDLITEQIEQAERRARQLLGIIEKGEAED